MKKTTKQEQAINKARYVQSKHNGRELITLNELRQDKRAFTENQINNAMLKVTGIKY